MRSLFRNKYNNLFYSGLLMVCVVFLYVRPLNSPWHPFIAGDGLGYYAYLPAKFIHNDPNLDFKWFNRVYNENYVYSTFENPEDNLLVAYKDKRINKYYQGLSYIWMPFFIVAHVVAKVFHFTPDGFSKPYQYFIGLASLFYLLAGLYFLRRLLLRLFKSQWVAIVVPFLFFYGTHLFTYAVFANTLSHAYSFTFCVGFLYYTVRFFQEPGKKTQSLILALLFLIISACIRPLNVLIVLTIPAFMPLSFIKNRIVLEKLRLSHYIFILLGLGAIAYQLWLTHIQTGSFFAYTYTDEKFNFLDARFIDALFSYHMGLFVYVPLILLSVFGVFFVNKRLAVLLGLFFLGMVFVYSSWWYWPICKRALIDFYAIPAILLAGLLASISKRSLRFIFLSISLLCIIFFQFKAYQISNGILDEYITYKEVFWKNFFATEKMHQFLVPPKSILEKETHKEGFEQGAFVGNRTNSKSSEGKWSLLLDSTNYICTVSELPFPETFTKPGPKKIKFSFEMYAEPGVNMVHAFLDFLDNEGKSILQIPFYINDDYIHPMRWELKEFGYEIVGDDVLNAQTVAKMRFTIWNVEAKKKVFIDAATVDFILTDRYFETLK